MSAGDVGGFLLIRAPTARAPWPSGRSAARSKGTQTSCGRGSEQQALRLRQDELESQLLAASAANWHEAAEKARYLLNLFAGTLGAHDPRRQKLIAAVLADFKRLSGES